MLRGYFDVSRGREQIYSLAGYIGHVEKWEEFAGKWKDLLASEDVTVFSPSDLESKVGEYRGWSNTRKIRFQQRAFNVINNAREIAIGHSISVSDFAYLRLKWISGPNAQAKSAYYHCGVTLLRNVDCWIKAHRIEEPIEYIFEFGDEGWGDVLKVFDEIYQDSDERQRYRMQAYSRQLKREMVQLQAAGVWAYESFKHWANTDLSGQRRKARESWKSLFRADVDGAFNTFDNRQTFDALIKRYVDMGGLVTRPSVSIRA